MRVTIRVTINYYYYYYYYYYYDYYCCYYYYYWYYYCDYYYYYYWGLGFLFNGFRQVGAFGWKQSRASSMLSTLLSGS